MNNKLNRLKLEKELVKYCKSQGNCNECIFLEGYNCHMVNRSNDILIEQYDKLQGYKRKSYTNDYKDKHIIIYNMGYYENDVFICILYNNNHTIMVADTIQNLLKDLISRTCLLFIDDSNNENESTYSSFKLKQFLDIYILEDIKPNNIYKALYNSELYIKEIKLSNIDECFPKNFDTTKKYRIKIQGGSK